MGFKLSRLAQAIMAVAFYSTVTIAAEKTDDFYIEIKGPENREQLAPQPRPLVIKDLTGVRTPQPYVPESRDKTVIAKKNGTYGPVKASDTTWSIANNIRKLYPDHSISTQKVMQALYRKNPNAFVKGKLNNLLAGSRLAIPSLDEINASNTKKTNKAAVDVAKTKKKEVVSVAKAVDTDVTLIKPEKEIAAPIVTEPVKPVMTTSTVASTEPSLVDSKVSELVGSTEKQSVSAATPTNPVVDNEQLLVYQTENKELKNRIQQLNEQIGHLQAGMQSQEELKQEIADLQAKLKAPEQPKPTAEQEKAPQPAISDEQKKSNGGFWSDILSTPLNLLLLISLPVLAVLVVLSFWLRSRAKREMAVREQEMSETTALMMDEESSDFSDLLAVDLSDDKAVFPDLNLEDESLIPSAMSSEIDVERKDILVASAADIEPAIIEELPPIISEPTEFNSLSDEIDLNAVDEPFDVPAKTPAAPDFSALLSDDDLAKALESDFSFSAESSPEPDLPALDAVDLSAELENDDVTLTSRLNIDKMMADPGIRMSDQVVSEPEGWEVLDDENDTLEVISPAQTEVNLQAVNDDSDKPWLQQFEVEQLETDSAATVPDDYLSIDELLAQADKQDPSESGNPDAMQANLDVGLDEFPDMLPEHDGVDIDDDGGVGAKLDLARAYLEIDDKASAKELLLEVQTAGTNEQIKEAEKLLSRIV